MFFWHILHPGRWHNIEVFLQVLSLHFFPLQYHKCFHLYPQSQYLDRDRICFMSFWISYFRILISVRFNKIFSILCTSSLLSLNRIRINISSKGRNLSMISRYFLFSAAGIVLYDSYRNSLFLFIIYVFKITFDSTNWIFFTYQNRSS